MVKIGRKTAYIIAALLPALIFTSCTSGGKPSVPTSPGSNVNVITTTDSGVPVSTGTKGSRSNEIHVLKPTADGVLVKENSVAIVDYSNNSEGYICVKYTGTSQKVKLRITGPDEVQYTYDISIGDYSSFPLTGGNGIYNVGIYENIQDTEYSTAQQLSSEYNLAFALYTEVSKQLLQAELNVKNDTPVLSAVKPVDVPMKKSNSRSKTLIVWMFFGVIVSCGSVFGFDWLHKQGLNWPKNWE